MTNPIALTDTCLAKETLQRSKGDAKQSTLQRFASRASSGEVDTKPTAPRQLHRSATAANVSVTATGKGKPRRCSSDSAMLLQTTDQPAASPASDEGSDEVLPIRKLQQSSSHVPAPDGSSAFSAQSSSPDAAPAEGSTPTPSAGTVHQQLPVASVGGVHFQTSIVGRRFRTNISCTKHTRVTLVRQPDNPRDSNAIQVMDVARQAILGYLPREIAQHLSALLDAGSVKVTATVDEPKSVAAAIPILLEVSTSCLCPKSCTPVDACLSLDCGSAFYHLLPAMHVLPEQLVNLSAQYSAFTWYETIMSADR